MRNCYKEDACAAVTVAGKYILTRKYMACCHEKKIIKISTEVFPPLRGNKHWKHHFTVMFRIATFTIKVSLLSRQHVCSFCCLLVDPEERIG